MMDKDTTYRSLLVLTLLNKVQEEMSYIINENNDARFRNMSTQIFTVKQDMEDKLREEYEESLRAKNMGQGMIPNSATVIPPVSPVPTNGSVVPQQPTNPTNVQPTNNTFANGNMNGATSGANNKSMDSLLDGLLNGAIGNNNDLKDALNQMAQQINQSNQNTSGNNAPF